ncbi:MAG: polysaccharide deacetylase family protein [Rhodospirillales bacterium]
MTWARFLQHDKLAIYLFHGVVHDTGYRVRNYNRKHLSAGEFRSIIADLKDSGTPMSLDDLIAASAQNLPFPKNAFAVTFDDGFENNLTVAAPILAEMGVPATFYVTTDFIDRNRMSWIDRIEWAFEAALVHGRPMRIDLPWQDTVITPTGTDSVISILKDIRTHVKTDPGLDPDVMATDIQRQLGFDETWSCNDPLDRKMTWDQVRELDSHDLFQVGGHSHEHGILSFLPPDKLAIELDLSLDLLDRKAGIGPIHYSYPEGLAHCYSDTVIDALKARGVICCPTAEDGVNPPGTDLFRLKRVMVM